MSWAPALTNPRQGYTLPKRAFRILVGIYYDNIPTHTPHSGYHGVTEVAKTADIAKMAKKYINCISACPTPPHANPMESGPGNSFSAQNREKTKRFLIFNPKKGGGHFFDIPPPPTSLRILKKLSFKWDGLGESGPKTPWGMRLLDKILILQGVKPTPPRAEVHMGGEHVPLPRAVVHSGGEPVPPSCAVMHKGRGAPVPPSCAVVHRGRELVPPPCDAVHRGGEPIPPSCAVVHM